jgi:signal transduction histidine kinase
VSGDAERLRQAISHLVAGAIERSPATATVKVSLASRDARVRLAIEDEAPHAAGGDLGRLIADAIAKRSGGTLRLEERPGKGTLAVLELPCPEEAVHG